MSYVKTIIVTWHPTCEIRIVVLILQTGKLRLGKIKYKGVQSGKHQRWDLITVLYDVKAGIIYETHQVPGIFGALCQARWWIYSEA